MPSIKPATAKEKSVLRANAGKGVFITDADELRRAEKETRGGPGTVPPHLVPLDADAQGITAWLIDAPLEHGPIKKGQPRRELYGQAIERLSKRLHDTKKPSLYEMRHFVEVSDHEVAEFLANEERIYRIEHRATRDGAKPDEPETWHRPTAGRVLMSCSLTDWVNFQKADKAEELMLIAKQEEKDVKELAEQLQGPTGGGLVEVTDGTEEESMRLDLATA